VSCVGVTVKEPLDSDKLTEWFTHLIRDQGLDLFRSKGVLNIAGSQHRCWYATIRGG
jgi:G3E family GTPase